jgi:hypothetical protein
MRNVSILSVASNRNLSQVVPIQGLSEKLAKYFHLSQLFGEGKSNDKFYFSILAKELIMLLLMDISQVWFRHSE